MPEYKTIEDIDIKGKKVLVRLDLNVPIKDNKIKDYTRIDASLKTIKYILDNNGKAILMSHLGRPGGEKNPNFSLLLVSKALTERLGTECVMAPDCIGEEVEGIVDSMPNSSVVLLENLRFYKGETDNNPDFVEKLSKLADIYCNDAFGTAHRAQGSTYGVPLKLLDEGKVVCAGFLMEKELNIWKPIVEGSGKSVAIVGGAKLKEKIKATKKFSKKFDRIILGGVAANVFMKAAGYDIGDSLYLEKDKDYTNAAKEVLESEDKDKIILPKKAVLATPDFKKEDIVDPKEGVEKGKIIGDVLPTDEDVEAIKTAERVVWFGPMGAYEFGLKEGSLAIVDAINQSKAISVIGGGDLAAAAEGINAKISTGGGASITYITKGKLEALEALKGNKVE